MKYLFFIQGEGRGHLTQALALKEKLETRGHTISALIVGSNGKKPIPSFFKDLIEPNKLITIASPQFSADKDNKGVRIIYSALLTIYRTPVYIRTFLNIKKIIKQYRPDILINFYESMAGNYYLFSRDKRPMFCIGHQYFINHPAFKFPKINFLEKISFRFYNKLTSSRRSTRIALSFTEELDCPEKKLFVCPPLIRNKIKNQELSQDNFFLVYLLNAGYSQEIINWCQNNPQQKIEAFWDKLGDSTTYFNDNLIFHYLDGDKFIKLLSACSGYASTAGFDSIAEAAYLQKNILMIPTKKHFEQKCNAADAERAQIAMTDTYFNISRLLENQQKTHSSAGLLSFKKWVDNCDNKIIDILEKI